MDITAFVLFNHASVTVGKDVVSLLKSYMIRFCNNVEKKMVFWIYSFLSRSIAGKAFFYVNGFPLYFPYAFSPVMLSIFE